MTKRALLIGCQTFDLRGPDNDVAAVEALLNGRGFACRVLTAHDASREGILAALRALVDETIGGDAALLYYSGHGGRIANPRHLEDPDREPRDYSCIIPFDHDKEDFKGIFSAELSAYLAALSVKTRDITVIFDCCHAEGEVAATTFTPRGVAIPWRGDIAAHRDWLISQGYNIGARADYVEGNPHAIRLAACKGSQVAYECVDDDGIHHGLMTEALLHVLGSAPDAAPSWHALGEAVRARVTARYPTQEPVLLGPLDRIVFNFDTAEATHVDVLTYLEIDGVPYLSGGSLHGVTCQSRYLLMPLNANRPDRELALAEAEVVEVATDLARIVLAPRPGAPPIPVGTRAFLFAPKLTRHPVQLVGLDEALAAELGPLIDASPRLCQATDATSRGMTIRVSGEALALADRDGLLVRHPWPLTRDTAADAQLLRGVVVHAEQLARVCDLLDFPPPEGPTLLQPAPKLRWGRVGDVASVYLPSAGARLAADDRIYIRVTSESPSVFYTSILGVGVDRSIRLLSTSAPGGVELRPGDTYTLGQDDLGQRFGVPLAWHPDVPIDVPQPVTLIAICTDMSVDLRSLESTAGADGLLRSLDELLDPYAGIVDKDAGDPPMPRSARYYRVTLELMLERRVLPVPGAVTADEGRDLPVTTEPTTPTETPPSPPGPAWSGATSPRSLPIHMLFISAAPLGQRPLTSENERRTIREAFDGARSPMYTLTDQPASSRRDVILKLVKERPAILHISCHGEERLGLLLQDEFGNSDTVPPEWLVERVEQNPSLGLVAVSACYSDAHAIAIAARFNVDAIGCREEIGQQYCQWFFGLFYEMLAHGLNVGDAFARALGAVPEAIRSKFVHAGPGVFPARPTVVKIEVTDPAQPPSPLPFTPSNIDFADIDIAALTDLDVTELKCAASTGEKTGAPPLRDMQFKIIKQPGGTRIGVYFAKNVTIARSGSLVFDGPNAGAIVALGTIEVYGKIDASPSYPSGQSPGGFKNDDSSDPQAGGPGGGAAASNTNGSGGGSYGGIGGVGAAETDAVISTAGKPYGNFELVPLLGGSAGGSGSGGTGGGAVQLVAGKQIFIDTSGRINAGGGGGQTGGAAGWQHGHGGGSGGGILLEAPTVVIAGVLAANGGGAGAGHMDELWGQTGLTSDQPAAGSNPGGDLPRGARGSAGEQLGGEDGVLSERGKAGGGGGGAGRIRINTATGAAEITGTVSPSLGTPCATQGKLRTARPTPA